MKKVLYVLYQPYKYLVFIPLFLISFLLHGLIIVILIAFSPVLARIVVGFTWSRVNVCITPMLVSVSGRENIVKRQSYVIVSNHQSHYDIFVLHGWLRVDIIWVMKQELRKVPIFGYVCEKTKQIYIDRSNKEAARASLEEAKRRIANGTSVIFFAEGTRSLNGELGEFKTGAFRMALDLQVPILPVTINGTGKILPAKSFRLFPGRASLKIHRPIDTLGYSYDSIKELMCDVKEAIESGLQ